MALTKLTTSSITGDTLAAGDIAADAITASELADNAVDTAAIAADAVTGAKIADDAINSEHYTDGSIDTAHIADDQITLAKMASGTDGNIISYDASGNPVAIATGSDGQVLTSTGAGSPPAFETASGTTINNNANNKVITGSGTANTLEAEANLIFNGSILGAGASPSADMGSGIHIRHADSGLGSADANADQLVIERNANSGLSIISANGSHGYVVFGDPDDNNIGQIKYMHDVNDMVFLANGGERVRIDGPTGNFAVGGAYDTWYKSSIYYNGAAGGGLSLYAEGNTNGNRYIQFKLANTEIGSISRNGTTAAVMYTTSSDYRLKENITDKTDGIEKIKKLKPRRFNWISDSSNQIVDGFIAHEVSGVVPEAVSGVKDALEKYKEGQEIPEGFSVGDNQLDENGNTIIAPQGIDQAKLVPVLVAALQEAITKIETLETKVTALENA